MPLAPNRGAEMSKEMPHGPDDFLDDDHVEGWLPMPLRTWFAIPLMVFMLVGAIVMEVLWFS